MGANHSPGTIADFALRISLSKLGLDPLKDVSLRLIGVLPTEPLRCRRELLSSLYSLNRKSPS